MAIIYTYPTGTVRADDLIVISEQHSTGNPTKNITVSALANFMATTGTGTGTTDYIVKWNDGPNGLIGDSSAFQFDGGAGLKQFILSDGYRFVVDRDAATTVGDPEYAITQNGITKTSFGWDDDGGGFGFLYNWEGNGFKFGSTILYPQLELMTNPNIKVVSFSDFEFDADVIDIGGNVGNAGDILTSNGVGAGITWSTPTPLIPWPYQYSAVDNILIQGVNPGTTGGDNTAYGVGAGGGLAAGKQNTCVGKDAGLGIANGTRNICIGIENGLGAMTASYNISIGYRSGNKLTAGEKNVLIGQYTGYSLVGSGSRNVAIGDNALNTETHGYNTAVGTGALAAQSVGANAYNVALGNSSGTTVTTGTYLTLLGNDTEPAAVGDTNCIVIGNQAVGHGSNTVVMGDANVTSWEPGANNVCDLGSLTHSFKDSWIQGIYYDTSGGAGAAGTFLSSTGTGTAWTSDPPLKTRYILTGMINNMASSGGGGYDFMEWTSNITSATQIPLFRAPVSLELIKLSYVWMGDAVLSISVGEAVDFTIGTVADNTNSQIGNYVSSGALFSIDNSDDGTFAFNDVAPLISFGKGDNIGIVGTETGTVTPNDGELAISMVFQEI